jgi:uncharacterized protein (TIGR02246 family)
MNVLGRIGILVGALGLAGCAEQPAPQPTPPPDTRAADEAAIRATIREWSASAQAKDAEKFVSFYAEDGIVMMEDAPDISGTAALREGISGMMQDPNFALSFEADKVVAARSGDLAYETGTYSMTMSGPQKKPATEKGSYVVVWRKQADGAWKVAVDVPVSDPAAKATTPGRP